MENIVEQSMTINAIKKREKRKLEEGTEKELTRKRNDSLDHRVARRTLTNIKTMLLKSPPRKSKFFNCVYIGNNKFADINGIYVEVVFPFDHEILGYPQIYPPLVDCANNKINLYQAVELIGNLRYQKNKSNANQFEHFYFEQCFFGFYII